MPKTRTITFLPSVGTISTLIVPTGPGVRVDSGVYSGYSITPYYDSMIAKLICWGDDRPEAMLRMRSALEEFTIMGVKHNIPVPPESAQQLQLHRREDRHQVRRGTLQHDHLRDSGGGKGN